METHIFSLDGAEVEIGALCTRCRGEGGALCPLQILFATSHRNAAHPTSVRYSSEGFCNVSCPHIPSACTACFSTTIASITSFSSFVSAFHSFPKRRLTSTGLKSTIEEAHQHDSHSHPGCAGDSLGKRRCTRFAASLESERNWNCVSGHSNHSSAEGLSLTACIAPI